MILEGVGLHTGAPSSLSLEHHVGPLRFNGSPLGALHHDAGGRSTVARWREGDRESVVQTVEHLYAALGALRVRDGIWIDVEGPEVPIVDGGAAAFFDALVGLGVAPAPDALVVVRRGVIDVGGSRYELLPGDGTEIEVEIVFDDVRVAPSAAWRGDAADFRARIAPARTFCFAAELEELARAGLARHVPRESVIVLAEEAVWASGRPYDREEPARHKLLDLIGDLYAYGGPPRGCVRARRPGHAATHAVMRRALAEGLVARA
jgi:UDP-3-O-[3-hydroxymyristoyl] N-acetylglucosamine deacetylase